MNNRDMPAMPLPNGADNRPHTFMKGEKIQPNHAAGLTKREHFAGLAPDVPSWYDENETCYRKRFFAWRAFYADTLLKELEK